MRQAREFLRLIDHILKHPGNRKRGPQALARFAHWQARKRLGAGALTVDVQGRRKFKIVTDSKFSSLVYYTGLPDWDEMNFLLRYLKPGDGFLDVGANVGFYTVLASTITDGPLWAIEANPRNAEVLRDQIALNGLTNVHVCEVAVGDTEGVLRFEATSRETGALAAGGASTSRTIQVPCRRLDDLLDQDFLDRCALAKIDIEGGEIGALKGAERVLRDQAIPAWLFELSDDNLKGQGGSRDQLLGLFRDHGYRFYQWDHDANKLERVEDEAHMALNNYVAASDPVALEKRLFARP